MDVINYWPLWLLVLFVPVAWAFRKSLVQRPKVWMWVSLACRCIGILLLVCALCRAFVKRSTDDVHVAFLVDVSQSIDLKSAKEEIGNIRKQIQELRSGDSWGMYAFAADVQRTDPDELVARINGMIEHANEDSFRSESRIAEALKSVRLDFPAGKARRVVLLSDGRSTSDELDLVLNSLEKEGVDVRVRKLGGISKPEVSVVSLQPSMRSAHLDERVRLTATVYSNNKATAEVRFFHRGVLEAKVPVSLDKRGDNQVSVDVPMSVSGPNIWTAEVFCEKDHFPQNNVGQCTIEVKGKAKILAVHMKPSQIRGFASALKQQGVEVELRGKQGLPSTIQEMLEFDAIVLANLPATQMTTRQMLDLKSYVSDFGGGLVMLGSENSFGLGGYYKSPVEEVLPLISRYEKEKEKPSLAMVMVIDKSGSMGGLPIQLARQAAKASVELLGSEDKVGVIAFDGQPYIVVDMASAVGQAGICDAIDTIAAGGGTNLYPAMAAAKSMLESAVAKTKHMIVLSDGQSMGGDFEGISAECAQMNITISTVALGGGAAHDLMKRIAELGRGRYYATMDAESVPRIFTKETMEASRSAIKEEPFSPVKVGQADLLDGINLDEAPFLLGYVMSRPKPTAKVLLATESGDPLLAMGRYGLGVTLAFTSDASSKWAGEWLYWSAFGKFWAQTLRTCIRKNDTSGVAVHRSYAGNRERLRILCKDVKRNPVNNLSFEAIVLSDRNGRHTVPVQQVGLGVYETTVKRSKDDRTTVRVRAKEINKVKVVHCDSTYPREYQLAHQPDRAFEALAAVDNGPLYAGLAPASIKQPLRDWLLVASILCFIASILFRRI